MLSARLSRDTSSGSHVGQTIRQPSTALLAIDSEDRWANYTQRRNATPGSYNYSPYDFIITKNESLMNGFFTRLAVSEVVFPWIIPNINRATQAIKMTYDIGAGPVVAFISLDQGFYDGEALAAEFATEVITAAGVNLNAFTMTYDSTNGLGGVFFYNTNDPGKTVSFQPMTYQPNPALPGFYPFQDNVKQLFDLMAFGNTNQTLQVANNSSFTFCQATRYVDIVCSQLVYNQALKDTMSQAIARDVLCRVYLGNNFRYEPQTVGQTLLLAPGTFPTIISTQFSTPKQIQWTPNQPVSSGLRFQLFDDNGLPLDDLFDLTGQFSFQQGVPEADWSMTILVSEN